MTMKKLALFVGAALLGSLPAAADEVVRTLDRQTSAADVSSIHLDFPVGEVQIDAGTGRQVQVHLRLECDSQRQTRCVEAAKGIEVMAGRSGDRLHIQLKGWPKAGTRGLEAHFVVTVPRDLPLKAELGVGEMRISGLESDLDADVGVGEIRVKMPEATVASVSVDTGVGDANLFAQGHRWESSGLVSRELKWHEGRGKAAINVDCGVGEAEVRLD
jgi:hypothetical protein